MLNKIIYLSHFGLKANDFIVFNTDNQLDWIAADFAILNIILMFLGAINKHRNGFPTIRTLKKIRFQFKEF